MKKYWGIYVLGALACGSVVAVTAVPQDRIGTNGGGRLGSDQVAQLDEKLTQKIAEQQELMRIVQRLLQMNAAQSLTASAVSPTPLNGDSKAPEISQVERPVVAMPKPAEPLWWTSFKLQLVYSSTDSAEAVINGKMYRKGQEVDKGVWVEAIESSSVVLARGRERHTYWLNK